MARKKEKYEYITDFELFDRNHFSIIKGIAAAIYVLVYLGAGYLGMPWAEPFLGLSAAICLLCSGYGVATSFDRKGGLHHYWENKVIKIWIPSLVAVVLTSLVSGGDMISWIGGNPLALNGWFLYLLMAEYGAFWVIFHYVENKNARTALLFAASVAGFFLVPEQNYAQQMLCFPVGVVIAQLNLKSALKQLSALHRALLCGGLLAVAVGSWFLQGLLTGYLQNAVGVLLWTCAGAFVILGVYYVRGLGIFGIFDPVGRIGYALYLLTPAMLYMLRRWMVGYQMVAVLVATVIVCSLYSWLREQLITINKNSRNRKKSHLKGMM